MNQTTLAYFAGILDGEGWFSIQRARHLFAFTYNPQVGVANTDKRLMDWLSETFGGKVNTREPGELQRGTKIRYEWRVSGKAALDVCSSVLPYLVLKKERAQLLLDMSQLISVKYRAVGVPTEIKNQREVLYLQLRKLNGRGQRA